jgi:hypothetical protein
VGSEIERKRKKKERKEKVKDDGLLKRKRKTTTCGLNGESGLRVFESGKERGK